jgi:hypothetical protein
VPGTLVWAQYPLSSLTLTTTFWKKWGHRHHCTDGVVNLQRC